MYNIPPKTLKEADQYINLSVGIALFGVILNTILAVIILVLFYLGKMQLTRPNLIGLIIEAVLYIVIAVGVYQKKTAWIVALFVFYVVDKFIIFRNFNGIAVGVALFLLFGMIAAISRDKMLKAQKIT